MENEFQGGKAFGFLKSQQEEKLNSVNEMFLTDSKYDDVADLPCKLESFKQKYMEFDLNDKGEIDTMGLKRMLEKLGMAKTHLELMKIMRDIGGSEGDDSISYSDFLQMMLGKRNAILKLILMYEMKAKGNEDPKESGPPPRRALSELP